MKTALVNARILTDDGFVRGRAVLLSGDRIDRLVSDADLPPAIETRDLAGGWLMPGFIDVQVNGGDGILFSDDPSVDAIAGIAAAHRRYGTTGLTPTMISGDLAHIAAALDAARKGAAAGMRELLGVHLEGPFLNVARRGVHDAVKIRSLDEAAFDLLTSLETGKTIVTLAPETTTPAMIRRLTDAGVIVSAGHTNGDYRTLRTALDHGLRGFTHLFNAMSPLTSREPGAVGAALEDQSSWCGLICDGRHVSPVTLKIALKTKPLDRFMLVTDGMPSVGMSDKRFLLQGRPIEVVGGVCIDQDGTLAGADLDMAAAVRNAVNLLGLELAEAGRMASRNPAAFLGLDDELGRIAPGYRADLVLLDATLHVAETWSAGRSSRSPDGR